MRSVLAAKNLQGIFVGTTDAFVAALREQGDESGLAIVDMNGQVDWARLGSAIAASSDGPPLLGFGPHVDVEGRRAAKQAGLTRIVSNGQFHQAMAELIDRYRRR